MTRRLAPVLSAHVLDEGFPGWRPLHHERARAELRALLAIPRAVERWFKAHDHDCPECQAIRRALSSPREKKRPARVRGGEGDAE